MEIVEIFFDGGDQQQTGREKNNDLRLRRVKTAKGEGARFILVDVVKLMGLASTVTTVSNRLDERDVFREEILTRGGTQTMLTVNVVGLLQTVLGARCKSEGAKRLIQWIRQNILGSTDLFFDEDIQPKKNPAKRGKHSPHTNEDGEEEDNFSMMAITFDKQYDQEDVAIFAREYQEQHTDRVLQASVYVVSCQCEGASDISSEQPQQKGQKKRKQQDRPPLSNVVKKRKAMSNTSR